MSRPNENKIYMAVVTMTNEPTNYKDSTAFVTHDKEKFDEYVKDTQDDINAGASYKQLATFELSSIDMAMWFQTHAEWSNA